MVSFALLLLRPPLQVQDDFIGLWLFHIQLQLLINGRNLSRVTVIQGLAKQARGVLPAPQFDQGTAFSLYFSSLLSSEGKLFIPWAISSEVAIFLVGVSLFPMSCLFEVELMLLSYCPALKSETKSGYSRKEVIFKVSNLQVYKRFITLAF